MFRELEVPKDKPCMLSHVTEGSTTEGKIENARNWKGKKPKNQQKGYDLGPMWSIFNKAYRQINSN